MEAIRAQIDSIREWIYSAIEPIQERINALPGHLETAKEWINEVFGPSLKAVFAPTNNIFTYIPESAMPFVSTECAVLLFQLAVLWVLFLKEEYVNIDRPNKCFWNDLRLWTILSMLPHM